MPKAIRFSPKRKEEILRKLHIVQINLKSVQMELWTGKREPMTLPAKDCVFNAALANEEILMAFGKKV